MAKKKLGRAKASWRSGRPGFIGWGKHYREGEFNEALEEKNLVGDGFIAARTKGGRRNGWVVLSRDVRKGYRPLIIAGTQCVIVKGDGELVKQRYDCFRSTVTGLRLFRPSQGEPYVGYVKVVEEGVQVVAKWSPGCIPEKFTRFQGAEAELLAS